jgi:hypothetical protein
MRRKRKEKNPREKRAKKKMLLNIRFTQEKQP